ncbi:MAG: Ig-like domain-containing protein [Armatimonadota bacterium]
MIRLVLLVIILTIAFIPRLVAAKGDAARYFVPITEAKLKRIDGIPTLHINGKPQPFIAWAQYDTYPNLVETAVRAGIRIYQPRLIAGFQTAEFIENQMKEVLAKDKNAYFLPSMWVGGDQIYGFDKRDSSEYNTDTAASWNAISFGSQEWVNRVELQLRSNIRKLENSKWAGHILGYMVLAGNTGEWFYVDTYTDRDFDRGLANQATWREWLRQRYNGDLQKLRSLWKLPDVSFETAEIPTKSAGSPFLDPSKQRNLVDYVQYHNERIADVTSRLASVIKQETRRKKLVAIYSGYNMELGAYGPIGGQLCMQKILASPDIDLIFSPLDYTDRGFDGFTGSHGSMDSIRINGKMHVGEDDYSTHIGTDHWGARPLAGDVNGSLALHWRNFGYTLTKGFGQWWYDDSGYGSFNNATMVNGFQKMTQIANAAISLPRTSTTQVALVVDEFSQMVQSNKASASPLNAQMVSIRSKLSHIGAPYDVILLSDVLSGKARSYKLLIMANAYAWDTDIRRHWQGLDKRGQTVMWLYAPGYWSRDAAGVDSCSDNGIMELTGLPIKLGPSRTYAITSVKSGLPTMDALANGEPLASVQNEIPFAHITDERGLTVLGRTDGQATAVLKRMAGWNELWLGSPSVASSQFYQAIGKLAGVHIYSDAGRAVNANASFVFVTIPKASDELIRLRSDQPVCDIQNDKMLQPAKDGTLHVRTEGPTTMALYLGNREKLKLPASQLLTTSLARLVIRTAGETLQEQHLDSTTTRTITLDTGSGRLLDVTGITKEGYYFYRDEMEMPPFWSSDRPDVVTVDILGYVKANQPGEAVITASVGNKTATIHLSVMEQPRQSIICGVTDAIAVWSTWSSEHGLNTFALGKPNNYGTASLLKSAVGEDGLTRAEVVRFQPLANGEQVGVSMNNVPIPAKRSVKLVARFIFPANTDPKTAATIYLIGYDQKLTGVLSKQIEARPTGKGITIDADLSAFAGKELRLDFLVRHQDGTPIEACRLDLAEAYLTWDDTPAQRSHISTAFTEMNLNVRAGAEAQLSVVRNYSDGSSDLWKPSPGAVWESSRPDIVAVSADGRITGLKQGDATITLLTPKTEASGPLMLECFVHVGSLVVKDASVKPIGLIASKPYVLLRPGQVFRADLREITNRGYFRYPSASVRYTVKQGHAVTVSADGMVKALQPGLAVIQADMGVHRTEFLVEVRKSGQRLTWEAPFEWTIFERMPDFDYSKILAYRYSGLRLAGD